MQNERNLRNFTIINTQLIMKTRDPLLSDFLFLFGNTIKWAPI